MDKIGGLKQFLRYWLPIIVWMALIFVGSTDLMSSERTSRVIGPILLWFDPGLSPLTIAKVQLGLRKAAHVSEYAVLAALCFRALVNTIMAGRTLACSLLVLVACAAYAATDEFHQEFVASRTASARDVGIDVTGAILAVAIYALWRRYMSAVPDEKCRRASSDPEPVLR